MMVNKKRSEHYHARGYLFVLLSTLGFASFGVWAKLIDSTYEVFTQAWTRALIVCVALFLVGYFTNQLKPFRKKDTKWIIMYSTFSLFTVAPIYYAFTQMDIGTATIMFYAAFIVTSYIIGRVFFGEKITLAKLLAIVMSVVGMSMIFGVELAGAGLLALVLAIGNGIASGGEVAFTKKISAWYSAVQLTLVSWAVILVSHFLIAAVLGEDLFPRQTMESAIGIVMFALAAMVAFWLVVAGYRYIEAGIGSLIGTLEVPFAILLGFLFFGERLSPWAIVGSLLIFLAAALPDGLPIIQSKLKRRYTLAPGDATADS